MEVLQLTKQRFLWINKRPCKLYYAQKAPVDF